jgi:hypothetical protein
VDPRGRRDDGAGTAVRCLGDREGGAGVEQVGRAGDREAVADQGGRLVGRQRRGPHHRAERLQRIADRPVQARHEVLGPGEQHLQVPAPLGPGSGQLGEVAQHRVVQEVGVVHHEHAERAGVEPRLQAGDHGVQVAAALPDLVRRGEQQRLQGGARRAGDGEDQRPLLAPVVDQALQQRGLARSGRARHRRHAPAAEDRQRQRLERRLQRRRGVAEAGGRAGGEGGAAGTASAIGVRDPVAGALVSGVGRHGGRLPGFGRRPRGPGRAARRPRAGDDRPRRPDPRCAAVYRPGRGRRGAIWWCGRGAEGARQDRSGQAGRTSARAGPEGLRGGRKKRPGVSPA